MYLGLGAAVVACGTLRIRCRGLLEKTLRNLRRWALGPLLRVLLRVLLLLALPGALRAEQASLREFGSAEGLGSLAVHTAVQDSQGFLWVGTENGLYRFDGVHFQRVGAAQGLKWIDALAPQGEGLWVGTSRGLWWLHRGQLVPVAAAQGQPLVVSDPGALAPGPDQSLWVAAKSGLHRLTPQATAAGWKVERAPAGDADHPEPKQIDSLVVLPDGTLWFGCGTALCRLRDGRRQDFGPGQGVPAARWDRLLRGHDGSLWARGGKHVLQLAPGADHFVQHDAGFGFELDEVGYTPLVEDAQRRILTSSRSALLRWDGRRWERFDGHSGLTFASRLGALVVDREGGLWLGVLGLGLLQWRGYGQWENWSARDGLPSDVVWRFLRVGPGPDRVLVAGTGEGVALLDAQTRRFRASASNATGVLDVSALTLDGQGALWVGTWGGHVIRHAGWPLGRGRVEARIDKDDAVYGLLLDEPQAPLIVGQNRLYSWRPDDAGSPPQPLDEAVVGKGTFGSACHGRDGRLWLGGSEQLLSRRAGPWVVLHPGLGTLTCMVCLRDGSLLVSGDSNGVFRLVPEAGPEGEVRRLRHADVTPAMLQGRQVLSMLEDRRGWWWVATDAGVAVYNGQRWRWLDQQAGLVWNDTSEDSLYEDDDGSIWIGTSRGASHLLAPDRLFEPVRGQVVIDGVRIGERSLALPAGDGSLSFPWSHDALEVPVSAPVYRLRGATRIEYRVSGFDERWLAAPADAVRLTGLPPGSYRFEARMVDSELGAVSPVSGFGFEIAPPWWRTPQAYAMAALGVLLLGVLVHRWRVRQVTHHAAALEALVQQRTQELEASRRELVELASRDALTGAWNRRALMEILERELGRARRERQPLTLLLADIDHFKRINDSHGHPVGDAVLREFVKRMTQAVRPYDAVGRYGGEEFVIVLPGLDPAKPGDAQRVQALHAAVAAEPMPQAGHVTCSFGAVALVPGMEADVDQLIALADQALYQAKRNGRDQVVWANAADLAA